VASERIVKVLSGRYNDQKAIEVFRLALSVLHLVNRQDIHHGNFATCAKPTAANQALIGILYNAAESF
jgi:hypothetical protein